MDAWIGGGDLTDGLDGFDGITSGLFLPRRDREGQTIHDDVFPAQTPLIHQGVDEATRDSDLVSLSSGLTLFIDGQGDNGSAVLLDQGHDGVES